MFVYLVLSRFFSIFLSCPAAMAVILLISFEHFLFPSVLDRRYSKFSKHSTVSPSTVMSDVFLHLSVSTILVFFILRKRPLFSLCSLTECISWCKEIDEDLHICFIDYSKAFDCVIHKHLWKTLRDMGINNNIVKLKVNLYAGQQAAVRLECGMSDWFSVSKGNRQGCILSPHLFSLYTEGIMREVEQDSRKDLCNEPNIQGLKLRDLRYADDTAATD